MLNCAFSSCSLAPEAVLKFRGKVSNESGGLKTALLTSCVGSCEDAELLERACLIPSFASTGLHVMQLLQFNYSVSAVLISAFKLSQGHQGGMAYLE